MLGDALDSTNPSTTSRPLTYLIASLTSRERLRMLRVPLADGDHRPAQAGGTTGSESTQLCRSRRRCVGDESRRCPHCRRDDRSCGLGRDDWCHDAGGDVRGDVRRSSRRRVRCHQDRGFGHGGVGADRGHADHGQFALGGVRRARIARCARGRGSCVAYTSVSSTPHSVESFPASAFWWSCGCSQERSRCCRTRTSVR